jgi:hypothetical protein
MWFGSLALSFRARSFKIRHVSDSSTLVSCAIVSDSCMSDNRKMAACCTILLASRADPFSRLVVEKCGH